MRLDSIKVGHWYETKSGIGQALDTGKRWPVAIKFRIVLPFPRGETFVAPRDVKKEVPTPEAAT